MKIKHTKKAMKKFIQHKHNRKIILIFIVLFASIGVYLLISSNAQTDIKPQIAGVADRQSRPSSGYSAVVNSYVVNLNWADFQPTGSSQLDTTKLDTEIAAAKANGWHIKLRIDTGGGAPNWVKNLPVSAGNAGPVHLCDTNGTNPACADVPHFWEQNVEDAYDALQTKLAAKYDAMTGVGAILQDVVIDNCTTVYQEPLLRQAANPDNIPVYQAAGYNEAGSWACLQRAINAHKAWVNTRSSMAFNPYQEWTGSGFKTNEDKTEQLIHYCRDTLGDHCVLGNNSIGKSGSINVDKACSAIGASGWASTAAYARMYTVIKCQGKPIYFQTATMDRITADGFTLNQALDWAASIGAGMVELPSGYTTAISSTNMTQYDNSLSANALTGYIAPNLITTNPKPVMSGLIDRGAFPSTSHFPSSTYTTAIPNMVVNVTWKELQTTSGGAITANNKIDQNLATLRQSYPNMHIKLRVAGGFFAPDWAKQLGDGPNGPVTNLTPVAYKDSFDGHLDSIGRFWTDAYKNAYNDFISKLAAKYDGVDEIQVLTISRCSTAFPEPFLRGASASDPAVKTFDANALVSAGYTLALDDRCQHEQIDAHKVWARTRSSLALNGYDKLNTSTLVFTNDEPYTETMMEYCRSALGKLCVLENDSLRPSFLPTFPLSASSPPSGTGFARMYWKMWMLGAPLHFQTAVSARIEDWRAALDGAIKLGANSIELVNDYVAQGYPPSELVTYNSRLLANPTNDTGAVADTQAPAVTITAPLASAQLAGTVSIQATATDNVGVSKVEFYIDGALKGADTTSSYAYPWDTTTVTDGSHTIQAKAYDAANNVTSSAILTLTVSNTPAPAPDTTPPSTPNGIVASAASYNKVNVSWNASTDNVGIASYTVWRDGIAIASVSATALSYGDTTVSAKTTYSYTIKARDAAGNVSTASTAASATTPSAPDTTPPSMPTGLTATAVSSSQINLAWSPSTDNVGVSGYEVWQGTIKLATVTSTSFGNTGLNASTAYSYTIKALDAAGNASAASASVSATTQAAPTQLPSDSPGTLAGKMSSASSDKLSKPRIALVYDGSTHTYVPSSTGTYDITSIPAGTYNVTYSANRYLSQIISVTIVSNSQTIKDVSLNSSR